MIIVGSAPAARRAMATMEVVVVFPWEPATVTVFFMRPSSASICARRTTGMPFLRA